MGLLGKIFFAVVADILLEIYVFVEIAERLGYLATAGLLIFFSIVGYIITKKIKYIAFQNAVADISNGKILNKNLIKSIAYFIAGMLFFIPGFITDFIAALFLIPFLNYYLIYWIFKYFKNKIKGNFSASYYNFDNNTTYGYKTGDEDASEKHPELEDKSGFNKN